MESLLLCGDTSHSYISASNKKKLNNNINNNNNNPSSKEEKKTKKFVKKCVSYYDPNLVVKSDIEILRFQIHYFELLQYKHGESFFTPPIKAFDHYWRLQFWPNGSNTGPQGYIACGLCLCDDPNSNPNPTISSSSNNNNQIGDSYFDVLPNAGSFGSIGSTGSTISNNGNNHQNQQQQKFHQNQKNKINNRQQPSSPPKAVWTFQINNHNHSSSFVSKEFTRVFNKFNQPYGENKLISVSNAINNYLDCEGSLIIDVHLQVYIQKQRTWYPSKIQQQQQDDDDDDDYDPSSSSSSSSPPPPPGKQYLKSKVGSDITFVVGQEEERIYAHKCILFHRSPGLYEQLFEAAADSEGADNKNNDHQEQQQQQDNNINNNNNNNKQNNNNNEIFLRDINVSTFKILLDYIYTGKLPNLLLTTTETESDDDGGCCSDPTTTDTTTDSEIETVAAGNNNNAPRQQQQQQQAKELLKVANRFNCSDLKLYIESVITDKLVTIDTAADWLLLADSYVCPLLKEECMKLYIENPIGVMSQSSSSSSSSTTTTTTESAWDKVLESNTLLQELLHFATIESKKIGCSSIQKNSSYDYDFYQNMSVRSLREKLESFNLNLDGTKNMLIQRLQNYHNDIEDLMLFSTKTKTTTTCNNTTQQQQQKPSSASADGDEPDAAMS